MTLTVDEVAEMICTEISKQESDAGLSNGELFTAIFKSYTKTNRTKVNREVLQAIASDVFH